VTLCVLSVACAAGCGATAPSRLPSRHDSSRAAAAPPIALSKLRGRIVFSRHDDVWVADANGSHAKRLTRRAGPEFDPSWSPDGKRIVYRDSRRGINENDELYVMNADGSHRRNLTHTPSNEWSPSWSPDGHLIAFYSGELYVMRPDGTAARPTTKVEGEYPAWSPDGKRLAFMSAEPNARGANPNYDVFVVNRDGTGLHRLTDWPGEDGWPAWSPDGRSIAFTTRHDVANGLYDVWVMRADGSGKHRIASGAYPVWSPDGQAIMLSASDDTHGDRLSVVRPDGSGRRELRTQGWLPDWRP
jgi:TolB protein